MGRNRRFFLSAIGTAVTTGLAGCTGAANLPAKLGLASPESSESWSTINESVAVAGQPTIEDGVPKAWGAIARTPEEADALIDWNAIRNTTHDKDMTPSPFRDFLGNVENHFVTALVGVLPGDESLKGARDESTDFDGNVMRSEVTSYKSRDAEANAESDDEKYPKYHYDYTFSLWNRNGVQKPDSYEVAYHKPK